MSKKHHSHEAMRHHLHPFSDNAQLQKEGVRVIVKAKGVYIYDENKQKILDAMAGLWCVNIGYGRRKLAKVAKKQMEKLPFYNTFFKTTHPAVIKLSKKLIDITPPQFNYVFYTNSGSESVDTMMRMVRHYWTSVGQPDKKVIIGRWNGYHGSTIGAASIGGMKSMHTQGGLPISNIVHIEQPWYYGLARANETEEAFGLRAANWLEEKILSIGADKIAAFVGEPIQGAGGVIIPPETYWPRIQEICQKYDILLVSDEVICGYGRTGQWFGYQALGFEPDIFTMAKGLSSGYLPIGAVLVNDKVAAGLLAGGEFNHGFTYGGHPVSAAVARANLSILDKEHIIQRVHDQTGPYLQKRWAETFKPFKYVADVRSLGLMCGFTLVKNKHTKTLWPNWGEAGLICRDLFFKHNLIMRACGDHIVAAPPLIITPDEIEQMLAIARQCMIEFETIMDQRQTSASPA
ncbi:aspartate aminotransferase family protein [Neisseriaceae bacterium ESL0693]|nr:aspartate aminotransferase family protein [Neisseriaceae bacterium ESL0693]